MILRLLILIIMFKVKGIEILTIIKILMKLIITNNITLIKQMINNLIMK